MEILYIIKDEVYDFVREIQERVKEPLHNKRIEKHSHQAIVQVLFYTKKLSGITNQQPNSGELILNT